MPRWDSASWVASSSTPLRRRIEGAGIGKGVIAGMAGTAAMTVSSTIEANFAAEHSRRPRRRLRPARWRSRRSTTAPLTPGSAISSTGATAPAGVSRAASCVRSASLRGWRHRRTSPLGISPRLATPAHFAAIWGSSLYTLPKYEVAPPVIEWAAEDVAIDVFHHLVYVTATGLAFELLDRNGSRQGA